MTLREYVDSIRNKLVAVIGIGVSNTLCRFIMVKYLKGFIEQYPHIKITIESQPTIQTLSMLEQQRIDILDTKAYLEALI